MSLSNLMYNLDRFARLWIKESRIPLRFVGAFALVLLVASAVGVLTFLVLYYLMLLIGVQLPGNPGAVVLVTVSTLLASLWSAINTFETLSKFTWEKDNG